MYPTLEGGSSAPVLCQPLFSSSLSVYVLVFDASDHLLAGYISLSFAN